MTASAVPNVGETPERTVSPQSTAQPITPAPVSPAPVQEKHPQSYYGPQPPQQTAPIINYAQYPHSYGQPVQSYASPLAAAPPPPPGWQAAVQRPSPPEESKKWRIAHLTLHSASCIFAITDIALSVSLLHWGSGTEAYYGDVFLLALYVIVAPAMALLWSGTELITRWVRTNYRGITPGAHVGVTLIIWLACIAAGGMMATLAPYITERYRDDDNTTHMCYNSKTGYYDVCNKDDINEKDIETRSGIFITIVAMKFLLWAVNFTLFVRACIETHRRNVANRPIVYVPYWAGPAIQGWQPLPQENIPMQNRDPGSNASRSVPPAPAPEVTSPAPSHQVQEYYSPGTEGIAR